METKNVLIISISIIAIIAIIAGVLIYTGFGSVETENKNFGPFKMDVPKGSSFTQGLSTYNGLQAYGGVGFVSWNNYGKYSDEIFYVAISTKILTSTVPNSFTFEKTEGNLKIYSSGDNNNKNYLVYTSKDDFNFLLLGKDLNLIKKMIKSIVVNDDAKTQIDTSSKTTTSSSASTTSTSSTSHTSSHSSSSSSSSNSGSHTRYCIVHGWVTTGSDNLCQQCVAAGYPAETSKNYKACSHHKDRGDGYCNYCLHPV